MLRLIRFILFVLLIPSVALAQSASLDAPSTATIGSKVDVTWTGPGDQYDPVYIVKPEAEVGAKGIKSTSIVSKRNPVQLVMPEEAGTYEIRYWSGKSKQILARKTINVVDVPTSIDAPETAQIGESIDIEWTGPGNSYDSIGLFEKGAGSDAKSVANATVLGRSPIKLNLPEVSGDYELRYVTRETKRILATRPILLKEVPASISAPDTAKIGEKIEIVWEGPGNRYDNVALFPKGAGEDAKAILSSGITSKDKALVMRLPEKAGEYELRYRLRKSGRVLATKPIVIGAMEVSLDAPDRATASTRIPVKWIGPGNSYDQIAIYNPESDGKALASQAILGKQNPISLLLPKEEGNFELRYITTQTGQILARRPIVVEPAGRLAVVFERDGEITTSKEGGAAAIELILDASGSMLQRDKSGKRRIEIAREVLVELVSDYLETGQEIALRVFGHKEKNSCRTDLEIPLGPLNRQIASARIASVKAMNLAKTPIADSLAKVPQDLAKAKGAKTIVLITDGEETCDGDPAKVIEDLRSSGLDVQVSIVGFAIDDAKLKETFSSWAELGGGSYFDANSAEELSRSLRTVISGPFRVLDQNGEVVGQGVIGGAPIVLPAGTYRVETSGPNPRVIEAVVVRPKELSKAAF
jgi:hypothetical protein